MTMITFTQADMRFIYRIVGVAIEDGRVLLHKAEDDDFWTLPSGRGELPALRVYPTFLTSDLRNLPPSPQHVVHTDI